MKNRAFTLIELLVVVAIIGILAAVGVVAYNGYTGAAKVAASKTIHKNVVKYISAEIAKCEIQETVMDGNLKCSGRTSQGIVDAVIKTLVHLKNPYGKGPHEKNDNPITDGGTFSNDYAVGYVRLLSGSCKTGSPSNCFFFGVATCYATPCQTSKTNNYILTELSLYE